MNYTIKRRAMICDREEPQGRTFKKIVDKDGRIWLYAIEDNAADHIYVSADPKELKPGYNSFRGFGGVTLTFTLESGEQLKLKAPWHSNSTALYENTGIDIRDKHLTYVVIARKRTWDNNNNTVLKDVIYQDKEPQVSHFDRGEKQAEWYAQELKTSIAYYSESYGGSVCGIKSYVKE